MADASIITQVFLPVSLAFIMLSVGLELTAADFKQVATKPKGFVVGAISQVVLLPLVAFMLVSLWDITPVLAVGVMIIAACPGGVTSNLMTYLARADTALSVSLTAIISLLSVVTLPLIVGASISHFMDAAEAPNLSIGRTVIGVFLITTVPVAIGMAIKHFAPNFSARCERALRIVASILFAVIIAGAIFSERENVVHYFGEAGSIALVLNVVMIAVAIGLGRAAALGPKQRSAITMECGLQNGTLAIFVALTLIGNREMMIPGAIYSLIMFPTALVYMFVVMRQHR